MQHRQPQSATTVAPVLDGRVFARQQLFLTLPKSLQEDAKHFRAFVEQDKKRLFQHHRHALLKSVYSVKGKDLIDAIIQWLHGRYAPTTNKTPVPGLEPAWEIPNGTAASHAPKPAPPSPGAEASNGPHDASKKQLEVTKQIAEALVLMGFLTPFKENETQLTVITANHYVRDSELLIPVAPSVTKLSTTSVWAVADGAVYARNLKRKAGVLGQFTQGKDVYVVVNAKTEKAYLFESDLARETISELSGSILDVQFDKSHFEFGVRVTRTSGFDSDTPETFNAESKEVQQELVNTFLSIGAKYEEPKGFADDALNHSENQYVDKFAEVPTVEHDDTSVPAGIGKHRDLRPVEHSAGPTEYHDQSFGAPHGTPAYAPVVTKHNDHSGDAHAAPHVAP
ncbi:Phospholipid hydroperoxide glutathione [Globisporangium polare]